MKKNKWYIEARRDGKIIYWVKGEKWSLSGQDAELATLDRKSDARALAAILFMHNDTLTQIGIEKI